jgi:radical SAM superfamily enzyme YgiQ (UPF0313 family)
MKVKKILLIRSSHYSDKGIVVRSNTLTDRIFNANYAEMGLPLLAALTPEHIDVEMIDDCLNETPKTTDADVVGISAMIIQLSRAIDLAQHFRKQGKIVVIGGFLATMNPEFVQKHFDSVCIGEAEPVWAKMLSDIEKGCLKKTYTAGIGNSLENIPVPRYNLIKRTRLTLYPVMATRGCIHKCSYCSVISFYQNTFRTRPIKDVIRDIKAHGSRFMYFVDDNLMDSGNYAKELFREMAGMRVYWGLQASPAISEDHELLNLAHRAGCRTVAIGFETLNQKNLDSLSKGWSLAEGYKSSIRIIQDAGIAVHALIMFGLPEDTRDVFDSTVNFLIDAGVSGADFFILTPYPATPLGIKYKINGLITDTDLNHYREPYVVFRHPMMSAEEIQKGFWQALERFYSLKNIYRRLKYSNIPNKMYATFSNLYYRRKIRNRIVPTHNQRGDYKMDF